MHNHEFLSRAAVALEDIKTDGLPVSGSVAVTNTALTNLNACIDTDNDTVAIEVSNTSLAVTNAALTELNNCFDEVNHHLEVDVNAFNGVAITTNVGSMTDGTQRVCIAQDDLSLASTYGMLFDFRFLSEINSTVYASKWAKYSLKTCLVTDAYFPGNGAAGTLYPAFGGITSSPPQFRCGQVITDITGAATPLVTFPIASINVGLPLNGVTIQKISTADGGLGAYARQLDILYYDDLQVLQLLQGHNISTTSATFNIRQIESMECIYWGANRFNSNSIYITNPTGPSPNYVAVIPPGTNRVQLPYICIPYEGLLVLDSLTSVGLTTNMIVNIIHWKQWTTTSLVQNVICQIVLGQNPTTIDLSHYPAIVGPSSTVQNEAVWLTAASTSAATASGTIKLSAKILRRYPDTGIPI